ncbi:DUF6907 domain-containing protein [Streptomyces sp. HGB0020]|uniref:DUF6907 domain-containing protein n=1 Tax=Streptomyces sp. HGB0020 TaxID=1078086 RepID=UPI00034E503C|nr:hypothetical protein [Streptomyces sp. HGB0020]EPD62402.1 hypothetical protein HMPREF1211_04036 [Streptomyces sp. HGB0020]
MNRTVTLATTDHGEITLPEPPWCAGHSHHDPNSRRVDLLHASPVTTLSGAGWQLGEALLFHAPYASLPPRGTVTLAFHTGPDGLTPAGLYDLAAAMEAGAGQLRALGDQLAEVVAEHDQDENERVRRSVDRAFPNVTRFLAEDRDQEGEDQ